MFVYKIQLNPIHTILKYGDYYDFIGNAAVLRNSNQRQLKEFLKLKKSGHEFIIFKILLIEIDWNSLKTATLPIHKVKIIAIF